MKKVVEKTPLHWELLNGDVGFTKVNPNFSKQIGCLSICYCVLVVHIPFWVIRPDLLVLVFLVVGFGWNQLTTCLATFGNK